MNRDLFRIRFQANADDPRPIHWPVKFPYWVTGYAGDNKYSVIVSYANSEKYIFENWPEAAELEMDPVKNIEFTDRFPKPEWWTE